jgi:hypothetical protein
LIARRSIAAAAALVGVLWATAARAQHGHQPAPAPHAAKAAATATAPDTETKAPPAKVPAAPKRQSTTELAKKLKEILDEASAAHRTPERARLVAPPSRPAAPAEPRIELTWRIALTWPVELEPARVDLATPRIALDWH